jgi:hypothetical protein
VCCAPSLGWIQPALLELRLRRSLHVPTSQVLLGSDFPFGTSADGIRGLEEYGLKPGDLEAIYRGNAGRLLPARGLRHMRTSAGAANGIGQPVRRKEDFRLLTGRGRYGDDLALPRMVHAVFVRSPHAHARIHSVDKTAALAVPGALAVLAGADYVADGLKPIPHNAGLAEPPDLVVRFRGMDPIAPPHWPLPIEKARFVGEGVAMVVAESIAAARDMAERVHIDYEPLPAVSRAVDAIKPGAPRSR